MSSVLQLSFIQSADRVDRLPPSESEVAFVGRSNVGKSSLINALANHRQLAHVSKTPGRTRLLNLFEVRGAGTLMDLPGYGYAQAPPDMRARWQRMIEDYLLDRENL
ncbi:MAG: ribosome biogenesis GTP-binding protein YihA/YsxC [Acidimicrobiia bacterium]|nr:ribosome biogenesis GTP-binding protein YihA/YsxC [Acidimicrobiia bacterium]